MFYGITKTLGGGNTKSMTYLRDMVDASGQYKVRIPPSVDDQNGPH